MKYGSVVFDMDGVLLNSLEKGEEWKFGAAKKALAQEGLEAENLSKKQLGMFLGDYGREKCIEICEKHDLDPEDVWKRIAETTNLARIEKIKQREFRLHSDARTFLESLKPRQTDLGVISNAPEGAVESTMDFFNLKEYFKFYRGVESFEDLKLRKPHPDHLKIAEAELKSPPYLYIGDERSDILAAKNAGMDAAWINRNNGELDLDTEYEAKDLKQLALKLDLI